jgi:hypothetical protein
MAPQRSISTKAPHSKGSGGLRQGTLSFTSAKRSGSLSAKDSLKGKEKAAVSSINPPAITPIRVGGKRKYEPDSEPEPEAEQAKEATEVLERERLDTEDSRWNRAFGLARAKMGNIQPGSSVPLSAMLRSQQRACFWCSSRRKSVASASHLAYL